MKSTQSKKHAKKTTEISMTIIEINKIFELNTQKTTLSSPFEKLKKKKKSFLSLTSISHLNVKI